MRPQNRSGEPYELPQGWDWATLASATSIGSTQVVPREHPGITYNYVALENIGQGTGGLINFTPTKGSEIGSNKYAFGREHLLFGKLRPYLRKVLVPDFEGISATDLLPIKPDPDRLDRRFLAQWLLSPYVLQYVVSRQTGVKMPRLRTGDLESMPVPMPPLPEQQRIVEKIERLLAQSRTAREALDGIPQLLKRFRQSVLAKAFRGDLTERDPNDEPASVLLERIREERRRKWEEELRARGKDPRRVNYVEPPPTDAKGLPELRTGWTWGTIGQVAKNFDGERIPVKESKRKQMSGHYPYYGASGIIDHIDRFIFDGEFLLVGEDGANLLNRATPIAFRASGRFWVNNHAHVLQTHAEIPLAYLEYFFNSIDLTPYVTGTAQPKMTQAKMNSIPIPLAPLQAQQRIVNGLDALLDRVDLMLKGMAAARRQTSNLDQAVLARAFRGAL